MITVIEEMLRQLREVWDLLGTMYLPEVPISLQQIMLGFMVLTLFLNFFLGSGGAISITRSHGQNREMSHKNRKKQVAKGGK